MGKVIFLFYLDLGICQRIAIMIIFLLQTDHPDLPKPFEEIGSVATPGGTTNNLRSVSIH